MLLENNIYGETEGHFTNPLMLINFQCQHVPKCFSPLIPQQIFNDSNLYLLKTENLSFSHHPLSFYSLEVNKTKKHAARNHKALCPEGSPGSEDFFKNLFMWSTCHTSPRVRM